MTRRSSENYGAQSSVSRAFRLHLVRPLSRFRPTRRLKKKNRKEELLLMVPCFSDKKAYTLPVFFILRFFPLTKSNSLMYSSLKAYHQK